MLATLHDDLPFLPDPPVEGDEDAWRDQAACALGDGGLAPLFFSEELQDIAKAKTICSACPVMVECLESALTRHEPWGVWGGQLFLNGKILSTKRRRGRPPKTPRPEDQLPDVPVPEHLQRPEHFRKIA